MNIYINYICNILLL